MEMVPGTNRQGRPRKRSLLAAPFLRFLGMLRIGIDGLIFVHRANVLLDTVQRYIDIRSLFDHNISMLHPINTREVASLSW